MTNAEALQKIECLSGGYWEMSYEHGEEKPYRVVVYSCVGEGKSWDEAIDMAVAGARALTGGLQ